MSEPKVQEHQKKNLAILRRICNTSQDEEVMWTSRRAWSDFWSCWRTAKEEEVRRYQEITPLALTEDPLSW